ncbi:nb-arc and ankyrin domain protein [Seiridium cupressi]
MASSSRSSYGSFPGPGMNFTGITVVFEPEDPTIPIVEYVRSTYTKLTQVLLRFSPVPFYISLDVLDIYERNTADSIPSSVVFVHGFTGHPYRTWAPKGNSKVERDGTPEPKRRKLFGGKDERTTSGRSHHQLTETCWPRDFVPAVVPDSRVRVLTFGYDTKIRHALGPQGSKSNVYDHAEALLQSLDDYRIDADSRKRRIIFIAHSLGGIVVKEAIRQSQRIGGSHRQRSLHQISESVIGIIFFGTPHRGADPRGFLQHIAQNVMEIIGITNEGRSHGLAMETRCKKELIKWGTS